MTSKGLRLRFKGDVVEKKKKKKSKRSRTDGEHGGDDDDAAGPPGGNEQAWVPVERITDLAGPSFIVQRVKRDGSGDSSDGDIRPYCLALNPALNRAEAHPVQASSIRDDKSATALLDLDGAEVVEDPSSSMMDGLLTPTDVTQVWVATRVLDTPSAAPRYTLRSSESRFLTSERSGAISVTAEARGPLEEWTLVQGSKPGHFYFQSANNTLLSLDETAGGKMVVRSDTVAAGPDQMATETDAWTICVQWKFREQARKKEEGEKPLRERDTSFKRVKATA